MRSLSKESVVVLTKAAELFIGFLANKVAHTAALRGTRTIRDTDVYHTIHSVDLLDFLRLDFPRRLLTATVSTVNNHASSNNTASRRGEQYLQVIY